MTSTISPFVVFGYGSLIFKPPPHVVSQVPGFLKGFVRRFALKSYDHRGTPENPGRVVTIIHKEDWDRIGTSVGILRCSQTIGGSSGGHHFWHDDVEQPEMLPEEDIVWGVAFTIDPQYVEEVRDYLFQRETDYTVEALNVYTIDNGKERVAIQEASCYISSPDHPSFVCSEPLDALALHIWSSVGPSGPNKDYLYQLAESMRALAPASYDAHLFTLEDKIRQLDKERGDSIVCY